MYRDPDLGLRQRRRELLASRRGEAAHLPEPLVRIYQHRVARVAAGRVGALAGLAVAVSALAKLTGAPSLLPTAWLAYLITYVAAYVAARARLVRLVENQLDRSGHVGADVDRLEGGAPAVLVAERADRLERPAAVWPLVAAALLAPLSIHYLVVLLGTGSLPGLGFGRWMHLSYLCVGHAHLILCAFAWSFGRALRRGQPASYGWPAWTTTTVLSVASAPFVEIVYPNLGIALYYLPPILVAWTGLLFVPAAFALVRRRVETERAVLAAAG